ncbi:MAG TPA: phosphatidate cytidylyltransferase [Saprospiraceae bacterium]|nr:phosphatidate cytidylyltransferase [Saprospiraceae bacterium]
MESVLRQRAISALIFVAIVISLFAIGQYGVLILLLSVLCGTLYEVCRLDKFTPIATFLTIIAALCIIYLTSFLPEAPYDFKTNALYVVCGFHLILTLILISTEKPLYPIIKKTIFIYPILGLAFAANAIISDSRVFHLILGTILFIWVCDSGAYLVGRKLGKHKLFERVSPKKTWEGFLGSLVFTIAVSYPISLIIPELPFIAWLIIATLVVIFGTIGDLIQSKVKREFGVKDSGNLLPGHGGWWDRFDSFIFVLPFVLLIATFF